MSLRGTRFILVLVVITFWLALFFKLMILPSFNCIRTVLRAACENQHGLFKEHPLFTLPHQLHVRSVQGFGCGHTHSPGYLPPWKGPCTPAPGPSVYIGTITSVHPFKIHPLTNRHTAALETSFLPSFICLSVREIEGAFAMGPTWSIRHTHGVLKRELTRNCLPCLLMEGGMSPTARSG